MPRILTVDDSQTMREILAYTLESADHEVISAKSGEEALDILKNTSIDLIITDLNMANIGGMELIKTLRAKPEYQNTPILMLTTETDDMKKKHAKALGATGWVVKPFNPEKLLQVVAKLT